MVSFDLCLSPISKMESVASVLKRPEPSRLTQQVKNNSVFTSSKRANQKEKEK